MSRTWHKLKKARKVAGWWGMPHTRRRGRSSKEDRYESKNSRKGRDW